MLKYALWLSLACVTLFHMSESSPASSHREPRSIWPFSSSPEEPETEPLIDEEHRLLLEKAGLGKTFNLSSHPLWKVHKYHGIDLKPVHIETEIIKNPVLDVRNLPTINAVAENTAVAEIEGKAVDNGTEEPVDLSFLDDLGGLAWLLPEPKENENLDDIDEATDLIADAIKKEEESNPGFFNKLWSKLWGGVPSPTVETITATAETPIVTEPETTTSSSSKLSFISSIFGFGQNQPSENTEKKEETLTIYLPETQGNYVAVIVPSEHIKDELVAKSQFLPAELIRAQPSVQKLHPLPTQQELEGFGEIVNTTAPRLFEPATLANHAEQVPSNQVSRPVAQWPVPGSSSQAWIQSWTPHASYNIHVQGPSSDTTIINDKDDNLQQTVELETPTDEYQRKISENEEQVAVTEGKVEEETVQPEVVTTTTTTTTTTARTTEGIIEAVMKDVKKNGLERARDILQNFNLPEGLRKKLQVSEQDVEAILNDKESRERAAERLRALQREFDMRKEQLSYVYPSVRKQNI